MAKDKTAFIVIGHAGGANKNSGLFDYEGRETLDDCGYGSMDYAPADILLHLAAKRGATLINA